MSTDAVPPSWRVRVWFGEHVIADYTAAEELANRYAAAMRRRFAGLRVTLEPIGGPDQASASLPSPLLWGITP